MLQDGELPIYMCMANSEVDRTQLCLTPARIEIGFEIKPPHLTNAEHFEYQQAKILTNSLPIPLEIRSSPTIDTFKRHLKTHYFRFPPT